MNKRCLHLLLAGFLYFLWPLSGFITFFIYSGSGPATSCFICCVMTAIFAYNIKDYREWIDEKYPKVKKKTALPSSKDSGKNI